MPVLLGLFFTCRLLILYWLWDFGMDFQVLGLDIRVWLVFEASGG